MANTALEIGAILDGKVTGITKFGAFVELPGGVTGMVHISEVAAAYVKEIKDHLAEGQEVRVKVLNVSDGKISLSIKKAMEAAPRGPAEPVGRPGGYEWRPKKSDNASFEDMMSQFKKSSDEKILDLKRSVDGKHGGFSRRGKG